MTELRYNSPIGELLLIADKGGLVYCNWIEEICEGKRDKILKQQPVFTEDSHDIQVLNSAKRQLEEYFAGKRFDFVIPLFLIGTDFQIKVWKALLEIRYGETVPYKKIAETSGTPKGYQAVAQACGANPISIIVPCHRVVAFHGGIGGYTGGIDKKITLLNLESQVLKPIET